jgi:sulfur-carrier protein
MSRVRIPPTLRPETGGASEIDAAGATIGELLDDLTSRFPSLQGKLEYANVYVDGEDVRTQNGLETELRGGEEVRVVAAIAGG